MLSIGDFSEMCQLSPQTLRFYHSEGLLVPAETSERTGYRSYTFDQVERAMLITVLRGTGMSVPLVRRALDEPDTASALLQAHSNDLRRRRQAEDEAIRDAREFLTSRPRVRRRHTPGMTVASKPVPGPPAGQDRDEWDEAEVAATIQDVITTVESCGAGVAGTPWRTPALETPDQKRRNATAEGPHWLVKIPITADAEAITALSSDVTVQVFEARDELSIFIPGKASTAKYATALSRLLSHPLDAAYPDLSRTRHLLHDNGIETTVALRDLDESDAGEAP